MATNLAKILADFTSSLAVSIAIGGTTGSLVSATDDDGIALPTGTYYFTLDGSNSQKEHIQATLTGVNLTNIKSVSRQGVITAGVVRAHRVGATVSITDFGHIKMINDLLAGNTSFDAATKLGYDADPGLISTDVTKFATVAYVNGVAIAGAPDSSTTVKGIVKMSVAPVSPTSPIAVGDNDPRVPTAAQVGYIPSSGEKLAIAGNNTDIAIGSGNKLVSQTGLQKAAEVYATTTGSANAYVLTLSPVPTSYAAGMIIRFKTNFANTGAATINVNGLGAVNLTKNGTTALASGDLANGAIYTAVYDGAGFEVQTASPNALVFPTTIFPQKLGWIGGTNTAGLLSVSAAITGFDSANPFYAGISLSGGANSVLQSYNVDSVTGLIYPGVSATLQLNASSKMYFAVTASYVYYTRNTTGSSAFELHRLDKAGLNNDTLMTISGTAPVNGNTAYPIFTDGTFLYINNGTTTTSMHKYSISGTTATFVSTITFTSMVATSSTWCDGTNVYQMTGPQSILKWPLAGGAATTVGTSYNFTGQTNTSALGVFGAIGNIRMIVLTVGFEPTTAFNAIQNNYLIVNPIQYQ